jgi:hypothetical protein
MHVKACFFLFAPLRVELRSAKEEVDCQVKHASSFRGVGMRPVTRSYSYRIANALQPDLANYVRIDREGGYSNTCSALFSTT